MLVSMALAIVSRRAACRERQAPKAASLVSSTIGGVNLKKSPVLTGSVTWSASAAGAQVSKVAFLIDDEPRWTESSAPYQFHGDPTGILDTTTLSNGATGSPSWHIRPAGPRPS